MFPTLARRLASASQPIAPKLRNATRTPLPQGPYVHGVGARYKLKKVWPPDFSKLPEKEQFRLERRYKRRVRLATRRPRWDKFVKLMQLASVTSVLVYAALFMQWDSEEQPFQEVRDKLWDTMGVFSSGPRHTRLKSDLPASADQE